MTRSCTTGSASATSSAAEAPGSGQVRARLLRPVPAPATIAAASSGRRAHGRRSVMRVPDVRSRVREMPRTPMMAVAVLPRPARRRGSDGVAATQEDREARIMSGMDGHIANRSRVPELDGRDRGVAHQRHARGRRCLRRFAKPARPLPLSRNRGTPGRMGPPSRRASLSWRRSRPTVNAP